MESKNPPNRPWNVARTSLELEFTEVLFMWCERVVAKPAMRLWCNAYSRHAALPWYLYQSPLVAVPIK